MMKPLVARITKRRTIRELFFAELIWRFRGCFLFFGVFGSYSVYPELNGIGPEKTILSEQDALSAIIDVLQSLPANQVVLPIFVSVAFVFLLATLGFSAYVVAYCSKEELNGKCESAPHFTGSVPGCCSARPK
jgi:betaine/carnitine transporter, BCCT family